MFAISIDKKTHEEFEGSSKVLEIGDKGSQRVLGVFLTQGEWAKLIDRAERSAERDIT